MTKNYKIIDQLQNIKDEDRARYELDDIVKIWTKKGVEYEAVDHILSLWNYIHHGIWKIDLESRRKSKGTLSFTSPPSA